MLGDFLVIFCLEMINKGGNNWKEFLCFNI